MGFISAKSRRCLNIVLVCKLLSTTFHEMQITKRQHDFISNMINKTQFWKNTPNCIMHCKIFSMQDFIFEMILLIQKFLTLTPCSEIKKLGQTQLFH